jgi:hypothetical protein
MSAIIKFVVPAELLFQSADDKRSVAANPKIKFCEPNVTCKPVQRFWKLSARVASPKFAIIEIFLLALFNDRCSGFFLDDIGRAGLLAVVFGVAVVLAIGCSSTGGGAKAGLITPVINSQWNAVPESNDLLPTSIEPRI